MISLVIFIVVIILILTRPFGLGIGYSAMAGAILNLLLGTISYDAIKEVVDLTWNATVAFVSLIMLCIALKEIGLFDWAASHMIHLSKGSCSKLFVYLVLLGALVSAIFANDGAALILTPIILAKVRMLNIGKANIIPLL